MQKILSILTVILSFDLAWSHDKNVVITNLVENYVLVPSSKGGLERVHKSKRATYLATRADESTYAAEYYDNSAKIDKASAPGAKAIYKSAENSDMFYTGQRVCVLPLDLIKGKEKTAVFEVTNNDPAQFCVIYLFENNSISKALYSITVPAELSDKIGVEACDVPANAQLTRNQAKNGDVVYSIELTDCPYLVNENDSPSITQFAPRLIITGFFSDYNALYKYLHNKVEPEQPTAEIMALANEIKSSCTGNDIDLVNAIADRVRNEIRYLAIEHGEYGTRPDNAAEVLRKKFGDCKGSANLMRMLMRAVGIDGRLVWVGTKDNVIGSFERYASMACGNHMIAAAVLPDTIIYVDGTAKFCPSGYIPASLRGVQVMIENGDECLLRTVPDEGANSDRIDVNGHFVIDSQQLSGNLKINLQGRERMIFENTIAALSAPRRNSFHEKYLSATKTVRLSDIANTTAATNATNTVIDFTETDRGAVVNAAGQIYVNIRPWRLMRTSQVDTHERHNPLHLDDAQCIHVDMLLDIPEGYKLSSLPEQCSIENEWFEGTLEYSVVGNSVRAQGYIRSINTYVPVEHIPAYNRCVRQLDKINTTSVVLTSL